MVENWRGATCGRQTLDFGRLKGRRPGPPDRLRGRGYRTLAGDQEASVERLICGQHIGYRRVTLEPHGLYALDTGAVRGDRLTTVVFPGGDVASVQVSRNYHEKGYREAPRAGVVGQGDPRSWTPAKTWRNSSSGMGMEDQACSGETISLLEADIDALGVAEHGAEWRWPVRRLGFVRRPDG